MSSETTQRPQSPLRKERRAQELRLADVAERAGISIGLLSMIENGYRSTASVRSRIAAALERPEEVLFP
jgi:transcriptional regulator with XRE-family HTH domain